MGIGIKEIIINKLKFHLYSHRWYYDKVKYQSYSHLSPTHCKLSEGDSEKNGRMRVPCKLTQKGAKLYENREYDENIDEYNCLR